MENFKILSTPFESNLTSVPYAEYPRPQLRREGDICLNGTWDLSIMRGGNCFYNGNIVVPFPIPSRLSGVTVDIQKNDRMIYSRSFEIGEYEGRMLLHFGAVDQSCRVFINDMPIGKHKGGYTPFTFDITDRVKIGENRIVVEVCDPLDSELPYGKQRRKRGGMWYTPTSGIWQTVWMECVPVQYITHLAIQSSLTQATISVFGGEKEKILHFEGKEYPFTGESISISPKDPQTWSPEQPTLYEFSVSSGKDTVHSYFALRTIEAKGNQILLNGKPYFFHGVLDQGYFSDGLYLPATPEGYEYDILKMKELGFNTLRKHIKVEPDLFYYYCDKYGMIVFQDFVNSGKYNFLIDTALPTVGLKKGVSHKASAYRRRHFETCATKTMELLYNHPSVCYYTIFNEGWGQYDADEMYEKFKSMDKSRIFDTTSGWFYENKSDVDSEHVYFKKIQFQKRSRPLVLSEFGGYSLKIKEHSFNQSKIYGYRLYTDQEKFSLAMEQLYLEQLVPNIESAQMCAVILTQLSDVEDETNGLFTFDRRVCKIDTQRMQALSNKLFTTYNKTLKE